MLQRELQAKHNLIVQQSAAIAEHEAFLSNIQI